MNLSRYVTLSLTVFGLCVGTAASAEPVAPIKAPAASAAPKDVPAPVLPALPPDGGACDSCWQQMCDCCDRYSGGLIGGVGVYVLQPYFENNVAFGLMGTVSRTQPANGAAANPPGMRIDNRQDISLHMEAAPLLWLGYISDEGLGMRARWWYFREGIQQSATGTTPGTNGVQVFASAPLGLSLINTINNMPVGAQSMVVTSKLQLQVFDFDALYEIAAYKWDVLLAGGLRLGSIDQTYNAYANGEALLSSNVFSGIGPTLAVEVRRTLGCTGLSLYSSARGAILFGSGHQIATVPDRNVQAQDHRDLGMPVAEAELGLEYRRDVGASHLFGQVTLVGQQWYGAGSASRSSIDVIPGGAFSTSSYVGDSDISFLGLCVRLGLNY
jgi:hypothetical protein